MIDPRTKHAKHGLKRSRFQHWLVPPRVMPVLLFFSVIAYWAYEVAA